MVEALTKILTPKRSIDVLRDVRFSYLLIRLNFQARAKSEKPFVITFVGVNGAYSQLMLSNLFVGVGKSTSLAKVCSWLLQNKMSVLIAACDTFRSGAVEQLQIHATRLGVILFLRSFRKNLTTG